MASDTRVEYRVRAVKRYVVTCFTDSVEATGSTQFGEFPNIEQADAVARALQQSTPGASFATIEERREPVGVFYAYTSEDAERMMTIITGAAK